MRTKEGGVMSIKEMGEAGIELPPSHRETWQTSHGPIEVLVSEPGSGAGIYDPETGEIRPFRQSEQLKIDV